MSSEEPIFKMVKEKNNEFINTFVVTNFLKRFFFFKVYALKKPFSRIWWHIPKEMVRMIIGAVLSL